MILLYTGALSANAPQVNSNKSLGGFVSSTPIPNGRLANLFSTISKSTVLGKRSEIRMIAIKNVTNAAVSNVKIYSDVANSHVKIKMAAVAPFINEGQPQFESVIDGYALPYQAALNYQEGVGNAIDIGSIAVNQVIGLWVLREVNPESFPELLSDTSQLTPQQLAELIQNTQAGFEESFKIIIDYNQE